MRIRALSITLAALVLAGPAFAQSLTDLLQTQRMTVLEVKKEAGRIYCLEADGLRVVEFGNGAPMPLVVTDTVQKGDLSLLRPGDVIKVESRNGRAHRITVLRRAADEIASPEQ